MPDIRQATDADISLIRELALRIWPPTYSSILSPEQMDYMLEMMYSVESLRNQLNTGCHFIIVSNEEQPLGFASFQEIKPTIFKLHKLYVLGSEQGKGTGKLMMDHIIGEIRLAGATALQLQVNRNNTARAFYEKMGFRAIEEADIDIGHGYLMNDYIMEKTW